ncbi:MAG: DDE-type integrase/transposase/recombinase [Gemmatimonadota bacterium]|nr:DDE-type integrase/transposase/recombinase [Gemmatimonadota bacterium]
MIRAAVVIVVLNGSRSRREAAAELRALASGKSSALTMALPQGCVHEVVRKYRNITASTVGRWVAGTSEAETRAAASGTVAAPLSDTLRHGNATRETARPPVADHLWQLHRQFPQLSIAKLGEMLREDGKSKLGSRQLQNIVREHFGAKWLLLTYGGDATEKELLSLRLAWETPHSNDVWIMDHSYLRVQPGEEAREKIPFWYLDDDRRVKQEILMATVIMDACSRMIIGKRIWPFAPTHRENMLVLFEALRRFGKPRILYTDNGADLICEEMREVLILLGIELRTTLPGEPQGRGKLERWFRTMKEELLPMLPGFISPVKPKTWRPEDLLTRSALEQRLEQYCDDYNARVHSSTKEAPAARYQTRQSIAGSAAVPLEQMLTLLPYADVQRSVDGVKHAGVTWSGEALLQVLRDTSVRLYFDPYEKSIRHLVVFSGEMAHYLGVLTPHDPVARFMKADARITARRNRPRLAS